MSETAKTARLKGFTNFGYFATVTDNASTYSVTGPRVPLEGAYSCTKTDNKTTTNIPADDNPAWDTESEWEDTTLTVVVRGMLLSDLAVLQGATFSASGDSMVESALDEAPVVALNFMALNAGGGYRCFAYFAAKLQSAQVNHQSKSGSTNLQDYTLEFRCKGRMVGDKDLREIADFATFSEAQAWLASIASLPPQP